MKMFFILLKHGPDLGSGIIRLALVSSTPAGRKHEQNNDRKETSHDRCRNG